jgi:translation initiation factor 1
MYHKDDEADIVYASDGSHLNKKEKEQAKVDPATTTLRIRPEKNHRGGKTVSLLYELPENIKYFQKLTKKIKAHCGTGGTYKNNTIEIQGDHIVKIIEFLEGMGFSVIKSGG